jgi:RimJ/RimL family protein N-acetyltransferase
LTLRLYVAGADDVPHIMRLERTPGYEGLVGRWDQDRHAEEMALPSSRYLLSRESGEPDGFVLFQGLDDPNLRVHLKRTAVADAGRGLGTRLLSASIDWLFTATDANRLDLEVFVDNTRARRAYEKLGFLTEGVLRDWIRMSNGGFRTMVMMSLLRREWSDRG